MDSCGVCWLRVLRCLYCWIHPGDNYPMSLPSFILPPKPRVVLWLGLLGHWHKKMDWLRRGFSLSGSTQLITSSDFPNTVLLSTRRPVPPLPLFICTINLIPVLPAPSSLLLSTNYFSHFLCCLPPCAQTNSHFLFCAPSHFFTLRSLQRNGEPTRHSNIQYSSYI